VAGEIFDDAVLDPTGPSIDASIATPISFTVVAFAMAAIPAQSARSVAAESAVLPTARPRGARRPVPPPRRRRHRSSHPPAAPQSIDTRSPAASTQLAWHAVHHRIVDRSAQRVAVARLEGEIRDATRAADTRFRNCIEFERRHADRESPSEPQPVPPP
jgi:hypothetical protein